MLQKSVNSSRSDFRVIPDFFYFQVEFLSLQSLLAASPFSDPFLEQRSGVTVS